MRKLTLGTLLLAVLGSAQPSLTPVGTYNTGLGGDGAEIISVREKDNLGAITNIAGSIDLIDLSNPAALSLIRRIPVNPAYGTPNSVAIHPHDNYFLVATGNAGNVGRITAYSLAGEELASAQVGIQPDSVAINHNGRYAVVANEAEGSAVGNNGGEGSLSIVDLGPFNPKKPGALLVYNVPLPTAAGTVGASANRTDDLARLPVDNSPATLEPESIAFSTNGRLAYITLQENNIVATLDLETRVVTYFGLGTVNHAADLITSGGYQPDQTLTAFREPDGIAVFKGKDGIEYFVTADEGDTRNSAGSGSVRGGRTVSVFNAKTGELVGDTGRQLDDAAAAAGRYDDSRSNRGGSEPEVLDVASYKGRDLVAVGLERAASVALIDVSDPSSPQVIALGLTGNNPEGVKFYKVNGKLYVLSANEASGTVTALLVE